MYQAMENLLDGRVRKNQQLRPILMADGNGATDPPHSRILMIQRSPSHHFVAAPRSQVLCAPLFQG
jgi:hypothetical protein